MNVKIKNRVYTVVGGIGNFYLLYVAWRFFANGFIGMFTTNPETIQAGGLALRIISSGFIVSSISVTASGALEGLGKGVQSLLISLMRYVIIIMPAAFILSRIWGAVGVWNAFWITELTSAIASVWIYQKSFKH